MLRLTVMRTDIGIVTANTPSRAGEVSIMPTSAPATVIIPVAACSMSLESEAFTVSMS